MYDIKSDKTLDFLARILLSSVFVIALPSKLTAFPSVVNAISQRGIPEPIAILLLVAAIGCISFGSILLVFGGKQKLGAGLLLIFLVPTTIIFHLFPFQTKAVFMNLGLIGGLMLALLRPSLSKERQ
tara:strand:+ start:112 stop:492 length:381 start_codon:yes stop_codon:yes gene_type:complete